MSNYLIDNVTLTDIADAIRSKTGGSSPILTEDMATEIAGISGGGCVIDGVAISEELSFNSAYVAPMIVLDNNTSYIVCCQKVDGRLFYLTDDYALHYNNPNGVEYIDGVAGICRHNGKLYIAKITGDVGYLTYDTTTLQYVFTRVGGYTYNNIFVNMCVDDSGNIYVADNTKIYDVTNNVSGNVQDSTYTYIPAQSDAFGIFWYENELYVLIHYTQGGNSSIGLFTVEYVNQGWTYTYELTLIRQLISSGQFATGNVCSCDIYNDGVNSPYVVYGLVTYSGGSITDSDIYVLTINNSYPNYSYSIPYEQLYDAAYDKRPIVFTYDSDELNDRFGIAHMLDSNSSFATVETIKLNRNDDVIHGIPTYYSDYQR